MTRHGRRTFLKLSGGVLGGIFAGGTVAAAERTDRYVVDSSGTSVEALRDAGLTVVHDVGQAGVAVVAGRESEVESAGVTYAPDIEYALQQPEDGGLNARYDDGTDSAGKRKGPHKQSASVTDESLYPLQWDKQALNVGDAHEVTRGGGTRVAIVDSGVAAGHPDLEHAVNTELSRDFTGDGYGAGGPYGGGHGTHVAGIVAASDRNGSGVVGTAPAAEVVDCRVFSAEEAVSFGDVLAAVVYATAVGADVANLSLGAYPVPRQGLGGFYGRALNRVMTYANREGTLLVIAAGNEAADLQHDGSFIALPAEGAQACSVAATGPIGFRWGDDGTVEPAESPAFYTNYGTNAIALGAPGGDADIDAVGTGAAWYNDLVLNTVAEPVFSKDGRVEEIEYGYGWKAGTSQAAPQVAGAAALVKSANPDYNADQVERALTRAAEVPDGYDRAYYGAGFLNVVDAL